MLLSPAVDMDIRFTHDALVGSLQHIIFRDRLQRLYRCPDGAGDPIQIPPADTAFFLIVQEQERFYPVPLIRWREGAELGVAPQLRLVQRENVSRSLAHCPYPHP